MNILYLTRAYPSDRYHKEITPKFKTLNRIRNRAYDILSRIREALYYLPIDAFFEASLNEAGNVTRLPYKSFNSSSADGFDTLIVHFRSAPGKFRGEPEKLIEIANKVSCKKVLYINADKAEIMMQDEVLDCYDLIIKREPFKSLDRYNISDINKKKRYVLRCYRACTSSTLLLEHLAEKKYEKLLKFKNTKSKFDIFFIGKATEKRFSAWETLWKLGVYRLSGGLLPRKGYDIDKNLLTHPLSKPKFIKAIQNARIALAIDGHGEFTFRHHEIWAAGGFLMSNSSLRDVQIPLSIEEGKHFVCYENMDDLIQKVEYYVAHPDLCDSIAKAGQEMFWQEYNVKRHGWQIQNWLLAD